MGWLAVLLAGVGAFLLFKSGHTILMVLAIIATLGTFWSFGIMHNYATNLARRRASYTGRFFDCTDQEVQAVPNWIALINMLFTLAGLVLLITGIVFLIRE